MGYAEEKAARSRAEMELGRKTVIRNMAQGLIDQLAIDYKLDGLKFDIKANGTDTRQWEVVMSTADGREFSELWWEFPTPELIAKLMLIGMI